MAREYGNMMIFSNRSGKLVDITESLELSKRTGIWNGIACRDLDGDGDLDYVLSNFGLNTTYKASPEKPERLFYGDLEGAGEFQIVEAKFEAGIQLPRRGMSCSSNAMPSLKTKLGTYEKFAISSLADIYTPNRLETSSKLEMTSLESIVLLNKSEPGHPDFEILPLPRMAQLAPAFGAAMTDLNGDGKTDIILAQNFHSPQREVGRMSGSVGATILRWTGNSGIPFEVLEARQAGIIINGDTKGLTVNEFNGDGIPDLAFTENNGPINTFLNTSRGRFLNVQLVGKPGNLSAVGAKIRMSTADGISQTAEVHGGGSYLSQSGNTLFFGMGALAQSCQIEVTWPDGSRQISKEVKPGILKLSWR